MWLPVILLFILWGWSSNVRAQSDFQPGYVVLPAGDTVRGKVGMLGTQHSFRRCVFQPSSTAASVTYLPNQLKAYGVWKVKEYRSGLVPVVDTARQVRFMEVLVSGSATLLTSSDDNNDPHFFLQRASRSQPEELRLIKRTQMVNGVPYRQEIRQYQQTLLVAFADFPALASRIRETRFTGPGLIDLFSRYNAQGGSVAVVSTTARGKGKLRFGVTAGVALGGKLTLAAASTGLGYYNTSPTKPVSPVVGAQLAFNSPQLNRNLWFQVGVFYQHRDYAGRAGRGRALSSTLDDYYDLRYEADFIHVPVLVRFEFAKGKWRPLLEAGVTSNFRLNELNNAITFNYTSNQAPVKRPLFENARVYEQGFLVGAGLVTMLSSGHLVSAQLRYELTNGISSASSIATTGSTFFALLSYDIASK